jgi:hypothetical protein
MMQRQDVAAGGAAASLELQIDLHIIQRWMLAQAVAAKRESPQQIALLFRADQLDAAAAGLETAFKPGGPAATPTRTQTESLAQIHKMSFNLPAELKDLADLDEQCKKIGYALQNVANSTPVDARTIPSMRPHRVNDDNGGSEPPTPAVKESPKTVAELSAEITHSAIAVSLRQQLLAVAQLAGAASTSNDPAQQADAASLYQMLVAGVDLAKGISGTTAFTAEARTDIETQLAEGLALFADPRTRAAGRDRIQQLSEYRAVMNRIARSRLSGDVRKALAPAFAYAQTHAEQGQKLLNAIDNYVGVCDRFDSYGHRENPVVQLRRVTEDVAKQFDQARQAFITSANEIGGTTGLPPTVGALELQVSDLSALLDLYAALDGMQQTYEVLNGYKPRPSGAIEQRVLKAAIAAAAAIKSPSRTDAIRFILDISKLAQLSQAVTQRSLSDVPGEVLKQYAGLSSTGEFESKCKLMFAELVNQVASGADMDKKKIDRLRSVGELCDGLRTAMVAEQSLAALPSLRKWVDWTVTQEQAKALLAPFQQLLAGAFTGFMTEAPDAVEKYLKFRGQFLPLIVLLRQDALMADQCAAMPDGLAGDLARLMTPFDNQPFSTERYLSYAVTVWATVGADDPDAAAPAADAAMKRLQRDVRVTARDLAPAAAAKPAKK